MLQWETGQISNVKRNSLDEDMPKVEDKETTPEDYDSVRLELTINHPRTKAFTKLDGEKQRSYVSRIYFAARQRIDCRIVEDTLRFEECQDGNVHLHSYVDLFVKKPYYTNGLVMSFVRSLMQGMPKRTHAQLTNFHFSHTYNVYKCPAVCVQLTKLSDKKRKLDWETYINKSQTT